MIIASRQETREWAHEEFGHAQLGDARRTHRLVRMAAEAARHPGGTVLDVFRSHAERQGAYDFLANPHIRESDILDAMAVATAGRCEGQPFVFVPVDLVIDHISFFRWKPRPGLKWLSQNSPYAHRR
jgi:Transposase DNA-binding